MSYLGVYIALPHHADTVHVGAAQAVYEFPTRYRSRYHIVKRHYQGSLLGHAFNTMFCEALNMRPSITHFAMVHADIETEPGWLDMLMEIQSSKVADLVSVVVPLKDGNGVTSTGVYNLAQPGSSVRRLTLKEVYQLPKTFSVLDIPWLPPDSEYNWALVVNTGLMVIDLRRPWVTTSWPRNPELWKRYKCRPAFTITDAIWCVNGQYLADAMSEDWGLSIEMAKVDCKVMATRQIRAVHHGMGKWDNMSAWGAEVDVAHLERVKAQNEETVEN